MQIFGRKGFIFWRIKQLFTAWRGIAWFPSKPYPVKLSLLGFVYNHNFFVLSLEEAFRSATRLSKN
jgi:hypothetical protein